MRKVALFATAAVGAILLSFDGSGGVGVSSAEARIGRPFTPFSAAGVHRRVMRRNFGVGWRVGGWHHPVARAAALGAVASGWTYPGWSGHCTCPGGYYGGGYGGYGYGAPGVGDWGSGLGWRPGFGVGAPGFGWHRGWGW